MTTKDINQWVEQMMAALPPSLQQLPQNIQEHLRQALISTFNKLDLVSREEFYAQTGVLLKTRLKLEQVEKRLQALEDSIK